MAFLNQYTSQSGDPQITTYVASNPIVEPFDGPSRVADVMEGRFPEAVYAQGPDTHLYKFLEALCGDAGAGLLRKQTYLARLQGEAEILSFTDLDTFYTQHLRFNRIRPEIYEFDTDTQALSPEEWDDVKLKDDRYKHRAQDFFNATRIGPSPEGMALAARAGSGLETEVREHYKTLFDQISDDPLGLSSFGHSASVFEFVVMPRLATKGGLLKDEYAFEMEQIPYAEITAPVVVSSAVRPHVYSATWVSTMQQNQSKSTYQETVDATAGWYFPTPDIQRNMVDILDRLRPVAALMSFVGQAYRHLDVPIGAVAGTSQRVELSRFVSGSPGVNWPTPDRFNSYFIQSGIENESLAYADSQIDLPVIFHSIEGVSAYKETALIDEHYNTASFYAASTGVVTPGVSSTGTSLIAPIELHSSAHQGVPNAQVQAIYPALQQPDRRLVAARLPKDALASSNTPLFIKGNWRRGY